MTWAQIIAGAGTCIYVLWTLWRTEHQFHAGYRKALDHVEEMTRMKRFGGVLTVDEAIRKLREETKR